MENVRLSLTAQEQLRWTGSTDQLYSVRRLTAREGPADGARLIEVCTSAGLRALFNESRALDLYELHFRGVNLGFASKNGLSCGRVQPIAGEFAHNWPAGLLATCGLRNTGPACTVQAEFHPAHGRIGGIPAEQVNIDLNPEENQLLIQGQMRESALFQHHLLLKRRIEISLDSPRITWHDTVKNLAAEAEPLFLLYHFNFGYPFLSPALQLHFPPGEVTARTEQARNGLAEFDRICAPVDGIQEQVFFHHPLAAAEGGDAVVRLINSQLGITAQLSYSTAELPVLAQWKAMKSGDYALGIEPANNLLRGRAQELDAGYEQILPGYGQRQFTIRLDLA